MNEETKHYLDETIKEAEQLTKIMMEVHAKIEAVLNIALDYGLADGEHHKQYALDQIVRLLTGDQYDKVIKENCDGEDCPESFSWSTGTAI